MGTAHPDAWAEDKRAKARRYAEGEVALVLHKVIPTLAPGSPVAAWIGVACNGSRNANTTGWITCSEAERAEASRKGKTPLGRALDAYARTGLHELGPFGPEGRKAPSLVGGVGSPWWVGARSELVARALGRPVLTDTNPGVTEPGAWYGAVAEQVAIGVWNNAIRHGQGVRAKLDARLRWPVGRDGNPTTWTLWPFALATMAWSAGDGGAAEHVNGHADALAALPEALRWGAFCRLAGVEDDAGRKHQQDEYSALRTAQKLAAALAAVEFTREGPEALAWLDDGLGAERDAVYTRLVEVST